MVDYLAFSNQMRPLCEDILNSLKIKESQVSQRVNKDQADGAVRAQNFLEMQDVWFQLV